MLSHLLSALAALLSSVLTRLKGLFEFRFKYRSFSLEIVLDTRTQ
jgi:hypothetical protein